jgi:hypothetical protein
MTFLNVVMENTNINDTLVDRMKRERGLKYRGEFL